MRVPRTVAWFLILFTVFTAGLLRQFHDQTPRSPYVTPVVGSMLFAAVLFVLLVIANEQKIDLDDALARVLNKYRDRDSYRWPRKEEG